ncbi:hypothetical protein NX059_000109 [Plenodomus lindquistii]|nr:hypothetical protein NX059_000109 [Plenodomus lindquistii]
MSSSPSSIHSCGSAAMSISSSDTNPRTSPIPDNCSSTTSFQCRFPRRISVLAQLTNPATNSKKLGFCEPKVSAQLKDKDSSANKDSTLELDDLNDKENIPPVGCPSTSGSEARAKKSSFKIADATIRKRKRKPELDASPPTTASPTIKSCISTPSPIPSSQATASPSSLTTTPTPPPPSLRDLHLAIGQHRIHYLPTLSSLTFDSISDSSGYIPLALHIGSYLPSDTHPLIQRTYSIWAYQTVSPLTLHPLANARTPIELAAFSARDEHVINIPGIGVAPSWKDIQQYVCLRSEFRLARCLNDVVALVRYALLVAADAGVMGQDDAVRIPFGVGFAHQLVGIGERGWEEERWREFQEVGVLGERRTWGALEVGDRG